MIEPKDTLDDPLPTHILTARFASESAEEDCVA